MGPALSTSPSSIGRLKRAPVRDLPNVHQIVLPTPWDKAKTVQVYVIEDEPLTLIDSGLDEPRSFAALEAALDELGHAPREVGRVVLTHYHVDHAGGIAALRRAGADVEVLAHEDATPFVERRSLEPMEGAERMHALFAEFGVPEAVLADLVRWQRDVAQPDSAYAVATAVDRQLRDGDSIDFKGFSLGVIHTPGHTAGHVCFLERASQCLFSGDTIMGGAVPHTENYYLEGLPDPADPAHRRPRFKGLMAYRNTLRSLRREPIKTILPGYGGVVRSADRAIREALLFYDVRIQRIERSLRSVTAMGQSVTAYEIWHGLFPNDDVHTQMRDKLLMVIGALDVLEADGNVVTARRDDGVLVHAHSS